MVGQQFTTKQRVFIVKKYNETRSYRQVREAFTREFPDRRPPSGSTIRLNVIKYSSHGTSLNRNQFNSGRNRSGRSEQNIERVHQLLQENPHVSCRRNGLELPPATFNRIVRLDLNYHPYVDSESVLVDYYEASCLHCSTSCLVL